MLNYQITLYKCVNSPQGKFLQMQVVKCKDNLWIGYLHYDDSWRMSYNPEIFRSKKESNLIKNMKYTANKWSSKKLKWEKE